MIVEPVVGILYNEKLNRWHPIYFSEHPLPGDSDVRRWKSGGHHTEGFPTREEAVVNAEDLADRLTSHSIGGSPKLCLEKDFPWDGEDIPAMVVFFKIDGGAAVPLF